MKLTQLINASILLILLFPTVVNATVYPVTSQSEFDNAHDNAGTNDTIMWMTGTYSNIYMDIDNDNLYITAEELGQTVFNGASRVDITGDYITLKGFQFVGGDIGDDDVIHTRGSYNIFTQINIRAYRSYKYLRVREESRYCEITYCNFENRLNLDDQNILSILVDDNNPGYHKIQHCSFKNFAGTGNDLGIEPIRIGVSTQADFISRSLVEYCYFTKCDGDGELISSKATQNVYRFNTFEDNPKAELVLRHGSEAIVYGNFFLNGKGGVRIREGQDHYIYNNYFYDIIDRPIFVQNEPSDPLDNINIAFNTIIECAELDLGSDGNDNPTNVTLANNIFTAPIDASFEDATGNETWIGNYATSSLGISLPSSGITIGDVQMVENSEGYFGLAAGSPAIDAAVSGYANLPQFPGMDPIDTDILFDLMQQSRPVTVGQKDIGCSEFPHDVLIQPIATEENTGCSYNTSTLSSIFSTPNLVDDLINIFPNPVTDLINITFQGENNSKITLEIFDVKGGALQLTFVQDSVFSGQTITQDVTHLASGSYYLRATSTEHGVSKVQSVQFVKL